MGSQNKQQVQIGDWVKLQSSKGERIRGYIEKHTGNNQVLQLRVITSDNHLLAGHSIQVQLDKLERETPFTCYTIAELEQLIDLALLTNDKAWFDALSEQYKHLHSELTKDHELGCTASHH